MDTIEERVVISPLELLLTLFELVVRIGNIDVATKTPFPSAIFDDSLPQATNNNNDTRIGILGIYHTVLLLIYESKFHHGSKII